MVRAMDRATQLVLNSINQRFYAAIAHEWSDTRKHPWPGFERIALHMPQTPLLRVLDVGSGDGRFAHYLAERAAEQTLDYLGCDASPALLAHARARELGAQVRFQQLDFVTESLPAALGDERFELICVLGVMHHVPSHERRAQLIRELATQLAPNGLLALTFWRLIDDPRFASRVIPFAQYNLTAEEPIALDQLESGDTLLRWGNAGAPPRYCHFPDMDSCEQLLAASALRIVGRFHADGRGGRLNEYVLLSP
jgi:tRNA (uracil-5-)-methyltransferase TRM9